MCVALFGKIEDAGLMRDALMVILSLPPAINQHFLYMTGVVQILEFTTGLAIMVYLTAFVAFLIFTSLFMRRSLITVHKASAIIGVAVFAFIATCYCVFIIPGKAGEIIEGFLMITVWLAAFVISIRILWRGKSPMDSTSIIGGPK